MVSRFVSMALAFALAATVSFAAGESDSAGAAAAADKKYVTDPTNGIVYTAPEYGGTLTYGASWEPPNSDAMVGGIGAGSAASGVVEKLGIANWGIDRSVNNLANEFLLEDHFAPALAESWDIPDPSTLYLPHPSGRSLARQGADERSRADRRGRGVQHRALAHQRPEHPIPRDVMGIGHRHRQIHGRGQAGRSTPRCAVGADRRQYRVRKRPRGDRAARRRRRLAEPGRYRSLHADGLGRRQLHDLGQEPRLLGPRREVPREPPALRRRAGQTDHA